MKNTFLPYRQIHLDFHTSEHIKGIGKDFDAKQFIACLKKGNVNSVTVFARGHHGWCYYPTNVGEMHPHLENTNLLGDMINSCKEAGIEAPVYITVQFDEKIAREHPGWRVMSFDNSSAHWPHSEPSASSQLTATWHTVCISNQGYIDFLIAQGLELVDMYDIDGIFLDILGSFQCVCPNCIKHMEENILDPRSEKDRKINDRMIMLTFFDQFTKKLKERKPSLNIFFNSGNIFRGDRERYTYYSHLEIESLPTGGWGYDHFPISARYADAIGYDFLGMTGKFHTHWGEFGGYKTSDAIEYECANMISLGAKCSIGDQLHPNGKMDEATYESIAKGYARVEALEPYITHSTYLSDVAVLSDEAINFHYDGFTHESQSDAGVVRMLLELKVQFDVIDFESDFSAYKILILPDSVTCGEDLAKKVEEFVSKGGKLIHSGSSLMTREKSGFVLDLGIHTDGQKHDLNPCYFLAEDGLDRDMIASPIVMYDAPYKITTENHVLGFSYPPYFNRTYQHFCSHLHAPCNEENGPIGPSVIEHAFGYYVSYNLFKLYYTSGQPLFKYIFRGLLERLLLEPIFKIQNLPSSGRASLLYQEEHDRHVINVLYAAPQARGSECMNTKGEYYNIELIEDVPALADIHVTVKIGKKPKVVFDAITKQPVPFSYSDGYLSFVIDRLHIHSAIIAE